MLCLTSYFLFPAKGNIQRETEKRITDLKKQENINKNTFNWNLYCDCIKWSN